MSSSENIIRTYPELSVFQVEYEGQVFDCNKCMGKGKCCGAENSEFNNQLACQKCRCQNLHDVVDSTRTERVRQPNCDDCDDTQFNSTYCNSYGHLNNNLKANITDCSNNFMNVGSNSTIEDVELRSECNVGGEENVNVITPTTQTQSENQSSINSKFIYGGGIVLVLILFYFLFF
jgi:hypothetical protein